MLGAEHRRTILAGVNVDLAEPVSHEAAGLEQIEELGVR